MIPFYAVILVGLMITSIIILLRRNIQPLGSTETHRPSIGWIHHPSRRAVTIPRPSHPRAVLISLNSRILPDILFPVPFQSHLPFLRVNAINPPHRDRRPCNRSEVTISPRCTRNSATKGCQHPVSILDQLPYSTEELWVKSLQHNVIPLSTDSITKLVVVGLSLGQHAAAE